VTGRTLSAASWAALEQRGVEGPLGGDSDRARRRSQGAIEAARRVSVATVARHRNDHPSGMGSPLPDESDASVAVADSADITSPGNPRFGAIRPSMALARFSNRVVGRVRDSTQGQEARSPVPRRAVGHRAVPWAERRSILAGSRYPCVPIDSHPRWLSLLSWPWLKAMGAACGPGSRIKAAASMIPPGAKTRSPTW
jgi:hypothetical protein